MDTFLCNDDGDIVLSVYDGLLTESSTSTTVSSADQVLNVYGEITSSSVSSGATSFTVDDASLFGVGDDILIYQVQNGTSTTVGYYEYRTISGVNTGTNTITVSEGLTNAYVSSTKNASPSYSAQIVRVQVYDTLTVNSGASITCDAWNGKKGGIVAIKCNTVSGSGTIHANYKGFRGGHYGTGNDSPGYVGEGIYGGGSETLVSGRVTGVPQRTPLGGMNTGGSGGEGASHAGSGGGGGGHVNAGTEGRCRTEGHDNPGGYAAPISNTQIFFGGGGGGGGDDDDFASNSWGGHGGGIVTLLCDNIASTITLESKGENHSSNSTSQTAAKGSGGAGGTIRLSNSTSATTDVSGGLGYVNTADSDIAYGGDGSVGIVSAAQADVISLKTNVFGYISGSEYTSTSPTLYTNDKSGDWVTVYEVSSPTRASDNSIQYALNNSGALSGYSYTRVGYLLTHKFSGQSKIDWVFCSFDKWSSTLTDLRVPTTTDAFVQQRNVTNLNVYSSNQTAQPNRNNVAGRLEIWPYNYTTSASGLTPAGSGTIYDYDDTHAGSSGYGSFQCHDVTNGVTCLAWNNHGSISPGVGIGNNVSGNPFYDSSGHRDWTFAQSFNSDFNLKIMVM